MPYIVTGDQTTGKDVDYGKYNYDYDYPDGLDLRPDSDFHKSLVSKILTRANESRTVMSKRFDSWREIDRIMTIYVTPEDKDIVTQQKEPKKPVSIVFPYSYSMLEALLTYMSMAFFQDPMFQYEGVEADDTIGAMLLELIVKLHCAKTKVPLYIHTVLRDSFNYGIGIGVPEWKTMWGKVPTKTDVFTEGVTGTSKQTFVNFIDSKIFEGNGMSSIDPYLYLPDPTVSSIDVQKGEFVGWIENESLMDLLSEESRPDSGLFNVRYLKHKANKTSSLALGQSDREIKHGGSTDKSRSMTQSTNRVDTIKMYIHLIPKDWKLGTSEYPEKWFFALSADDVIVSCEPANHNHGMYPIAVASPEFDGYSATPIGRMEVLYGLQHTLDFLFNSHVENVRKSINDMLVVDPFLVNINDLKDPKPGKLIRLRRPAWGRGVDKVVQQLAVQDITRANIADSSYITQWMDRISGADQSMQGALRQGGPERLTKSEFQGTRGSAVSRLQRLAMMVGMQFMQDIGTMFAVHTQQYMENSTYVKVLGRYEQQLKQAFGGKDRVKVSPADLAISYDIMVRDGSIPGGNFSDAWMQLFKTIGTTPELMQQFDVVRIFTYIAQQLGAKNVEDFKRVQTTSMPDEQVLNQVGQGNLVPMGGEM
jgi:hypothetical protein